MEKPPHRCRRTFDRGLKKLKKNLCLPKIYGHGGTGKLLAFYSVRWASIRVTKVKVYIFLGSSLQIFMQVKLL